MKRIIISILLTVAVAGFSFAQEPAQATQEKTKMTEEQKRAKMEQTKEVMNLRLQIIKEELSLSDEQFEKFSPIYHEYNRNINSSREKSPKIDIETASAKDINAKLRARFDNQVNTAVVRKTYIIIFEKVITPQQLYKLYSVEDKLIRQARKEYEKRQAAK